MGKYSISFVLIILIFGLFTGAVFGSLLEQVFGIGFLNIEIFSSPVKIAENFYILKNLELQLTPASLLGLVVAGWFLYKRGKS